MPQVYTISGKNAVLFKRRISPSVKFLDVEIIEEPIFVEIIPDEGIFNLEILPQEEILVDFLSLDKIDVEILKT